MSTRVFRTTWLAAAIGVRLALAHAALAEPHLGERIASAALAQVGVTVFYDPAYTRLSYPGGDVAPERGVCSDVVIRALRVDLQQLVNDDMRAHFSVYPQKWGLRAPDRNIDHRRVLNLQTYFQRRGIAPPITRDARDYETGDIVAYTLPGGLPHIGVVATSRTWDGARPLLLHNIGAGAQIEDVLFAYEVVGHYRWR